VEEGDMAGRILVIDDEPQITRVLRAALSAQAFDVRTANDPEEGLRTFAEWAPDLVITDLMMPGLSGVEVCRAIRATSSTPILVLSVRDHERSKIEALDSGADDYVTKPFGPRELVARLEAALRRARPEQGEPALSVDGLEIDLAARIVRSEGEEVHLTPTEFELLRALVRNRGRLMTHRELLLEVWGAAYEDDLQVLRAHVANLRRKIEPPGEHVFIRTDPGVGNRFAA
jgi:two-component system KDP operon response regulator KdpE